MSTSISPAASHDHQANAFARLFKDVHEGIYVGVIAVHAHDCDATVVVNPHLKRMFGYAPAKADSELHPLAAARFVDPADRSTLIERLRTCGNVRDYPLRLRRLDCSEMSVEITAHGVVSGDRFLNVDVLVRDVDRHAAAAECQRELAQQEAAHAEHQAALGYALSSVAHELNNPLATIIAWAERIAEAPFSESARRGVPLLLREAQRAARIVRNLLTLSRKRPSTRKLADVNQLIRETLALRAHDQRVLRISVSAALTPALPTVFVDAHQIQQVLLNLIINAEQAMTAANGRGALSIRTSHHNERRRVVIEVSDDGPGVSPQAKDRIFDPFFTTKAAGEGTGLGLTVAHAIVREHGGSIQVSARPSGGATFVVELPVTDAGATSAVITD